MRFWWVNHKKTSQQEIAEGYLWSPKSEASGARSQFYDNMKLANPGDIVLSFANGLIAHIGMVSDYAITASKPDSFGSIGDNWGDDGWLLPVAWSFLSNPVRPKDHIRELAPLLPIKYSPIHPVSGNGNQKAYFAEISQSILNLLVDSDSLHSMRAISVGGVDKCIRNLEEIAEKRLIDDQELNATVKEQLILARHGQGLFRENVSKIEKSCRLTKIENPRLLIASHIKPWRLCRTAEERLDGSNGLLLAPHVDHLFDRGLIGFEGSGNIILSPRLDPLDLYRLGLSEAGASNCGSFNGKQAEYLSFHREKILLS